MIDSVDYWTQLSLCVTLSFVLVLCSHIFASVELYFKMSVIWRWKRRVLHHIIFLLKRKSLGWNTVNIANILFLFLLFLLDCGFGIQIKSEFSEWTGCNTAGLQMPAGTCWGIHVSNCTTDLAMVTGISRVGKEKINLAIVLIDTNSVL